MDPRYVREDYLAQIRSFITEYRKDCSEGLIEYVVTDTSVPYDLMLTEYLGRRRRYSG